MLLLHRHILQLPVASIQASHRIGLVDRFIIQPKGLKIAALGINAKNAQNELFLHTEDVLEARSRGILIDHNEQLMESEDLVRLQELLDLDYQIIDKRVEDESGRKIGSVDEFIVNTASWDIQKIHVQPSIVKMLGSPDRVIDRSQIVRVTDKKVIVREASAKATSTKEALKKQMQMRRLQAQPIKAQSQQERS